MKEVLEVDRGLRRCQAQAGEVDYSNEVVLKANLARATHMDIALSSMDAWQLWKISTMALSV